MSAESIIKSQARKKLSKNGWTKPVFALGVLLVFFMFVDVIANTGVLLLDLFENNSTLTLIIKIAYSVATVLVMLLLSPALFGFFRMFYTESEYEMDDLLYYFKSFKRYLKCILFVFSYILRVFVPAVVLFIPVAGLYAIDRFVFDYTMNVFLYNSTFVFLVVLSLFALYIYSTKYFLSIKFFCEPDTNGINYCFKQSKKLMKGMQGRVIKLFISFIPWMLLCITVVPAIYVIPYITQSMCISGKWIYQLSRNEQ